MDIKRPQNNSLTRTIEAKGETLAFALENGKSQVPEGWIIMKQESLSNGEPMTLRMTALSVERAFEKAQAQLPLDAKVLDRKVVRQPEQKSIEATGFSEQAATNNVGLSEGEKIENVILKIAGTKGFLGFGKKESVFQVDVSIPACIELTYAVEACVKLHIVDRKWKISQPLSELRSLRNQEGDLHKVFPRPDQLTNQMHHRATVTALFKHLYENVYAPFNKILSEAKDLLPDCLALNELCEMKGIYSSGLVGLRYPESVVGTLHSEFRMAMKSVDQLIEIFSQQMAD